VIGVFSLGSQKKTFVKGFTVNTIFDDVSGLQRGNNVWLSGVKIGSVKKMTFLKIRACGNNGIAKITRANDP
jgi:phospholipid/cholesterol/gamma-HCH transport system substrate-binding protein